MRVRRILMTVAAATIAAPSLSSAGTLTPATKFTLSSVKALANPRLTVRVAQDRGEEELARVLLRIPAGFSIPTDAAVRDGEQIGAGSIEIAFGPECAGAAGSYPYKTGVKILERDRTAQERSQGIVAVWVVDLRPVTSIDLLVRGSKLRGWTLTGTVPQNSLTCPPFVFTATIAPRTPQSKVMVFRNPVLPGRYVFEAVYYGTDGSKAVNRQVVVITR